MDELYGKKVGVKHPDSVKAEMMKDSIACIVVLFIGMGTIFHIDSLFN